MEAPDYSAFAEKCVEDLKMLQDKFQHNYNLDWYENWFYNQTTGLLTFSNGEEELNFKYFQAGTFSENAGTWKWAWDNEHTRDNVKEPAGIIKVFGLKSNFPKLTEGCFESDEFEAWEFAAIAAKLAGGVGVYRPVGEEQLQIFLVLTEFVDKVTAQHIKDKYVECSAHEYRRRAFVCGHLNHNTPVGFEESFETWEDMELGEDDDLQAWCDQCEAVRQQEGGWNDNAMSFAQTKIVCEKCYFEMKELNLGHK